MPMLVCGNEFAVSLAFLLSGVRCLPLLPACSLKEEGVVHALHGRMYVNLYWGKFFLHMLANIPLRSEPGLNFN